MPSQGVVEEAKNMRYNLGVGSSQPRLHFDNSDEALLNVLKGNIIERYCNYQNILVPGVAETIAAPFVAVVRSPAESPFRNAQSRVSLTCRFQRFPSSMAGCSSPCAAEQRRLRPAPPGCIHHVLCMHCMSTSTG